MPGIELSPQPMKTKLHRGSHGQVFVITSRNVPEYYDAASNVLRCSAMVKIGGPIRRYPDKPLPQTPWSRLLYQCRKAKESNHQSMAETVAHIRRYGFEGIESV